MTSGLRESLLKKYCILPVRYKIKMLHKKPSSIENLKEGATFSLLTCYTSSGLPNNFPWHLQT